MSATPTLSIPSATLGEFAQAKIRCWMNLALITLALIAYRRDPSLSLVTIWYTFLFTALSAFTLLVWARALSSHTPQSSARVAQRIASIALDNLSISWILYFGGETLAGVFSVYLWISIGYGLRFGLRYLFANLAASVLGFFTVATLSPFWREYSFLAIGLGVGLVVIALYTSYLITQLHAAVRRAESASRAKSDFLAKMSHELRTPLHGIIALADLLGGTQSQQQRQEMLRQISVSSNTLLDLINRILDISKYESGTFALQSEPMNLHSVVDDTVSILASQARAKNLELSIFFDAAVENRLVGSPRQVQEILINLAGNALKFTERGGVRISVLNNGDEAKQSRVRIIVRDTGPGIPREYLQRVFDPFTQADDSITRAHGGSGLGTTIARDLVHLMGGEIAIDSEVGIGTTVMVDLAFPHAPAPPALSVTGLRIGLVGNPPFALEDALVALGLNDVVHAPDFVPRSADCLFVAIAAEHLLNELNDTAPPALGVGPASARDVAEAHPLLLSYVDESGDRTQVRRALELVLLARSRAEVALDAEPLDNGHAVLIAEDNLTNQMIARIALERAGYRCTVVDDGEKALDELSTGAYDIALIDMHMPHVDGLELARLYNFTSFESPRRTPLVMLTADSRPEAVADADLAGIARFLVKPVKPSALLRTVHDVLEDVESAGVDAVPVSTNAIVEMTAREVEPPDLEPVIFGELLGFMEPGEARQFFGEFREDALAYINTLRRYGTAQVDFTKVRDDMHALCGAARTVGAMRLAALARRIEYGQQTDIREQTATFIGELEAAASAAMRLIEQRLSAAA